MKLSLMIAIALAGISNAFAEEFPAGYARVEYLRSSGTQYIDTGYLLTPNSRVDIDFTVNDGTGTLIPYGFGGASDEMAVHFAYADVSQDKWTVAVGRQYAKWSFFPKATPGVFGAHCFSINDAGRHVLDGNVKEGEANDFVAPWSAFIFGRNDNTGVAACPVKMDLRAFDIYESGVLVRSYRPALRAADGALGLYETQAGTFCENRGTGAFVAPTNCIRIAGSPSACGQPSPGYGYVYDRTIGLTYVYRAPRQVGSRVCTGWRFTRADGTVRRGIGESAVLTFQAGDAAGVLEWIWEPAANPGLPVGYLPLEYLRGTGTQYINTEYLLTSNSRVDMDFTLNSFSDTVIPYGVGGGAAGVVHFVYGGDYKNDRWVVAVGGDYPWKPFSNGPSLLGPHVFSLNNGGYNFLDDVTKAASDIAFASTWPAFIFGRNDNTGGAVCPTRMDLRAFDIYESGQLVRSYRPAFRQSDRVAGLYESIEKRFYGNAGTGAFEPSGGFVRISGQPADFGQPIPAYGCAYGRDVGTEYVYQAPARCRTADSGSRALCKGWRFTRLDGTQTSGSGNEARFVHTAADDGGTLEWLWEESVSSYGRVNRSVISVVDGALGGNVCLTNFPLLVRVSSTRIEGFDYDQCASDGSNLWFSDSPAGKTALPTDVDHWNPGGESTFWVKVPSLRKGSRLYMFWGAPRPAGGQDAVWEGHAGVWHCTDVSDGGFTDAAQGYRLYSTSPDNPPVADATVAVIGRAKSGGGNLQFDDYLERVAALNGGDRGTATVSGWFHAPVSTGSSTYYLYPFSSFEWSRDAGWYFESTKPCRAKVSWLAGGSLKTYEFGTPDYRKEWVHVAVVSESAKSGWSLFLNGVRMPGPYLTGDGALTTWANGPLTVVFDSLDEFRVRASASSADWIQAEYAQGANPNFLLCGPKETFECCGMVLMVR